MSKQSNLDQYFTCKSSPTFITGKSRVAVTDKNIMKKTRSLSLVRTSTPVKVAKSTSSNKFTVHTIQKVLNSDDEDRNIFEERNVTLSQHSNASGASNSSQSTIVYNLTPSTPKKSPKTSNSFKSPNSEKYFSPIKKRAVFINTPVKRNLARDNFNNIHSPSKQLKYNCSSVEDNELSQACEGMDDKSIFLITIVNKFLKNDRFKALLDEKSVELLNSCFSIIKPGIRLICRLYWRKHGWYRMEQLPTITYDKKEATADSQFVDILNYLVENGLVTASATFDNNTMDFDDLVKVLKSDEIKQICKDLKIKIQSKQDAVKALRKYSQQKSICNYFSQTTSNNFKRVLNIMRSKLGTCYRLSEQGVSALDKMYLLTYLGINYEVIRDKRLELMFINDKIKRETYPVDKEMELDNASIVFKNKEEFARYWHAHLIYEEYLSITDSLEKCSVIVKVYKLYNEIGEEDMMRYKALPTWLRKYTPPYLYVKILESGIPELKKDACHHQLALDILTMLINQIAFRQRRKAEWYAEKALVLHKLMAKHDDAADVLLQGLKSSMSEEAKDAMRPRANKIANQQNIQLAAGLKEALIEYGSKHLILEKTFHAHHVTKQHMETNKSRGKKKFEVHTEDGKNFLDAEDYCILDYTSNGDYTHGEHWEGRIVTTIFHLLFWDIIYSKPCGVVGIFLCRYQLHPLDMYDENFYVNRKTLIDDRLLKIEAMTSEELVEIMEQKWEERPEHELSGINRTIGWDNVRMVASCLGARATAALCRRLATNYGYSHSGFPDLTLWNLHTKKIKFVEVKTDTDKPSIKQLQWMQYLRHHDIDTGFCYVGVSSTRCRARAQRTPSLTIKSVAEINSNGVMVR